MIVYTHTHSAQCAGASRAGARTGLQLPGHGDMQGFNSSSPAMRVMQQLMSAPGMNMYGHMV